MSDPLTRHVDADERRELILAQLRAFGFRSVAELAGGLRVSAMTVRRDLRLLESEGGVRLVHGGACLAQGGLDGGAFARDAAAAARRRVAAVAVDMVGTGDTIAVDAGMTALTFASTLPESFAGAVITHSLPVVQLLAAGRSKARLVALGGELCADRQAFVGPCTEAAVAGLRARTYFLEPVALDEHGIYAASPAEASVQRRLMEIADEVVVIATSAVFNGSAPARIAPLTRLARIVIDKPAPYRFGAVLSAAGLLSHTQCHVGFPG